MHRCVACDVDLATSTTLGHTITAAVITCTPTGGVLVDLAAVTFLDCTGVTAPRPRRSAEQVGIRRRGLAFCVTAAVSGCPKGVGCPTGWRWIVAFPMTPTTRLAVTECSRDNR